MNTNIVYSLDEAKLEQESAVYHPHKSTGFEVGSAIVFVLVVHLY